MNDRKAQQILIITTTLALLFCVPAAKSYADTKIILGYYTGDSTIEFRQFHTYMNQISTDTLNTDSNGNIVGNVPKQAVSYANSVNVLPYALVSNYGVNGWDSNIAHQVLTNSKAKNTLIKNMLSLVKKNKYKGINIDFEAVLPKDRKALTAFVKEVSQTMKANNFLTMVSVPAKSTDDPSDDRTGAYDYEALGNAADYIQVMTYDEHGVWSDPGSVASAPWIESSLKFSTDYIPSEKVIMGIPEYGNDWNLSDPANKSNSLVEWKNISDLIATTGATPARDEVSGSMYFNYTDSDGCKHVVWYEDETSIKNKTHYTQTYELAGVSTYAIGMEDQKFWEAISSGLK
ncbi:glycosyl hydrolase family 18 protein [Brevibacillus brevis]|uniref:Spore protein O n=1 Tax=Brevibacillus brevis TaxID=1393 RepID=A0A517I4J9_BREBE|nr:glycosyl hydrolase family 18 protein [Brevibacillus brevis]QDS33784.1 spore protein O [Brevibacillus brevis]